MNILTLAMVGGYLYLASKKKWFPFHEEKRVVTTLPSRPLKDYPLEQLRDAYLTKMRETTGANPELMRLEREFMTLIRRIDVLVAIEYPKGIWSFHQKNVGASIVLNTKVQIDIITYDGMTERRMVLIQNRQAKCLESLCDETTEYGAKSPSEEFLQSTKKEEKPERKPATRKPKTEQTQKVEEDYATQWLEAHFEYLEELRETALSKGETSILVPKEKYEDGKANIISSCLVEKCGYEMTCIEQEGVIATICSND